MVEIGNSEAIEAWDGVRSIASCSSASRSRPGSAHTARRRLPVPARGRRARHGHRLRFRRHDPHLPGLSAPEGEAVGVDAAPRLHRGLAARRPRPRASRTSASRSRTSKTTAFREPASTGRSRAWGRCSSPTRSRRCAMSAWRWARRAADDGRLAPEGRERLDVPRPRAIDRAVPRRTRKIRRADLRPGPVLDGRRRHDAAGSSERRFEAIDPDPLRPADAQRRRPLPQSLDLIMAIGPAGELIRVNEAQGERLRPPIEQALARSSHHYDRPDGICAQTSTWIVAARNPA